MNKYPLIGVSILAVVLLVLGSLSNVVGYQSIQSSGVNDSPLFVISSNKTSPAGQRFSLINISVYRYFPPAPIFSYPVQRIRADIKNIGGSPIVNTLLNTESNVYRYSFFKKPYKAGADGQYGWLLPGDTWQPNETRTFPMGQIYDKSFLRFFPIKYYVKAWIWTGNVYPKPEDVIIDGDFLIWGYKIIPV